MKFPSPLLHGTLLKRYRRFLVDVELDDGNTVTAHCPNSGILRDCCEPGRPVLLFDTQNRARRHTLNWEYIDVAGTWVGINPKVCRRVMQEAIEAKEIPSLSFYHDMERDATYGIRTKIDVILHGMEKNGFVNLYQVTWARDGVALFPDEEHPRAVQSLKQLAEIARQGHHAAALFLVAREDCSKLRPAEDVDRDVLKALLDAEKEGVEILVYQARITPEGMELGNPIPHSLA